MICVEYKVHFQEIIAIVLCWFENRKVEGQKLMYILWFKHLVFRIKGICNSTLQIN